MSCRLAASSFSYKTAFATFTLLLAATAYASAQAQAAPGQAAQAPAQASPAQAQASPAQVQASPEQAPQAQANGTSQAQAGNNTAPGAAQSANNPGLQAAASQATAPTLSTPQAPKKKIVLTPGMPLTITTASENIRVTNDAKLARDQVTNYPDSPEAHFVLAVALTRTSQVEEALKEIRIARKLSTQKGGAAYFDKMIDEYENMLGYYPNDNEVRYHLAWAYYMKAYVLARYSKSVIHGGAANPNQTAVNAKGTTAIVSPGERQWQSEWVQQSAVSKPDSKQSASNGADKSDTKDAADATTGGAAPERTEHGAGVNSDTKLISQDAKIDTSGGAGNGGAGSGGVGSGSSGSAGTFQAERPSADKAPDTVAKAKPDNFVLSNPLGKQIANLGPVTAMDYAMTSAAPEVIPQIKSYYERALKKLDEVLEHEPDDLWANLYRAHLRAEYSGDIDAAMTVWQRCQEAHPNSPAPYFFLGEGYLKKGDLRQCLTNVSKAIALRAIGN